jgi:GH35 family endo-1,4-beta-xylanase
MEMENTDKIAVIINSYTERKLSTADIFNDYLNQFEDINKDLLDKKLSDTTLIKNAILNKLDIEDYCKKIKRSHKVREEFNELIEELKEKGIGIQALQPIAQIDNNKDSKLIAECYVQSQDISKVKVNNDVNIYISRVMIQSTDILKEKFQK